MNTRNQVVCINSPSRFASYLKELLAETEGFQSRFISAAEIDSCAHTMESSHYFMDYTTAVSFHSSLIRLTEVNPRSSVSIFEGPEKITTSELVKIGRLKGYFFSATSRKNFRQSVLRVLAGECDLPPVIASQLINYYQGLIIRFNKPHSIDLTQREIEVLKCLRSGFSNNRLAEELFISEHTVKSHLYKIFKKLNVSSRNQAIEWSHIYLP